MRLGQYIFDMKELVGDMSLDQLQAFSAAVDIYCKRLEHINEERLEIENEIYDALTMIGRKHNCSIWIDGSHIDNISIDLEPSEN